MAGLGYGWAFMRTQRIEAAMAVHFGVNAMHFLLFTYPRARLMESATLVKSCVVAACMRPGLAGPGDGHAVHGRPGLFNQSKPDLGLRAAPKRETVTIFKPQPGTDQFNNGVVLLPFKGKLYAQWQSSPKDEDSQDTWVAYSVSDDGMRWSSPAVLAPAGKAPQMHSSGGWWTDGETLVAFINVWPTGFQSGEGGYTDYLLSSDGRHWSSPRRVTGHDGKPVAGIIEQDPHVLPGGRLVTAFHTRPGTRSSRRSSRTIRWASAAGGAADAEPSARGKRRAASSSPALFLRGSCVVMVFRDQASSFRQLASESCDAGETWTDARAHRHAGFARQTKRRQSSRWHGVSRQCAASGQAAHSARHHAEPRRQAFDRAWLLRGAADLQPLRFEGSYKRPGYHYPKSVIWKDHLYVGYATNKEDVELTRVPLSEWASPQSSNRGRLSAP